VGSRIDLLKDKSIKSHKAWKSAGRPRSGSYFNKYKSINLHINYVFVIANKIKYLATPLALMMLYYRRKEIPSGTSFWKIKL